MNSVKVEILFSSHFTLLAFSHILRLDHMLFSLTDVYGFCNALKAVKVT